MFVLLVRKVAHQLVEAAVFRIYLIQSLFPVYSRSVVEVRSYSRIVVLMGSYSRLVVVVVSYLAFVVLLGSH